MERRTFTTGLICATLLGACSDKMPGSQNNISLTRQKIAINETGDFEALVKQTWANRSYFKFGPFADALKSKQFDVAEAIVRYWLEKAPQSSLVTALLDFKQSRLSISSWSVVRDFLEKPTTAAIGLDFSQHVLEHVTSANMPIPFEVSRYEQGAFPIPDLTIDSLQALDSPWQGSFTDIEIGADIKGISSLVVELNKFHRPFTPIADIEQQPKIYTIIHLCEAAIYLHVNRLIFAELTKQKFGIAKPVIVGDHDLSGLPTIVYLTA